PLTAAICSPTVTETSVNMADWEANTTLPGNSSHQCSTMPLTISTAFFDLALSAVGLSVTIRQLWLTLCAQSVDVLRLNLIVFQILNNAGLLIDLAISIYQPWSLMTARAAFLGLIVLCGPLILCCICIERYVAVVHPTRYRQFKARRFREFSCAGVWAVTLCFPYGWEKYMCTSFKFVACVFLCSLLTMVWCNYKILQALKKTGPGRDTLHPKTVKALTTVRLISLLTLVFYIPAAVTVTVFAMCQKFQETVCVLIPLCIMQCSSASIAHPFFRLFIQQHLK
ncbi:hypothetical protein NFI96_005442, partial [Prochilodus magdalenae]